MGRQESVPALLLALPGLWTLRDQRMPNDVKEGEQRRVAHRCGTVLGWREDLRKIRQQFIAEVNPLLGGAVEGISASAGRERDRYVCREAEQLGQDGRP